jgi:hypothetical protein
MVICGSYMFEFSVTHDMEGKKERKKTVIKGEFHDIFYP